MSEMVAESVASPQDESQDENRQLAAQAAEQAAGLRALAAMIESHPEMAPPFEPALTSLFVGVGYTARPAREALAAFARAAKAHGAAIAKDADGDYFDVVATWPGLKVKAYARRDQVCERVVVGTETVTKEVPDPELLKQVPTVETTETVERVEWRCAPLLAEAVSR